MYVVQVRYLARSGLKISNDVNIERNYSVYIYILTKPAEDKIRLRAEHKLNVQKIRLGYEHQRRYKEAGIY
jgi:hypothetical protein